MKLKTNSRLGENEKFPVVFIAPALIFLLTFSILPILIAGFTSLTDLNFIGLMDYSKVKFLGFSNYAKLINDKDFIQTLGNTAIYLLLGVPLTLLMSLGIAILLSEGETALFSSFRVVYYLPSLTNVVAIAVVFGYIFNSQYGLINYILSLFGIDKILWLQDPFLSKIAVVSLAVWRGLGINVLIFLAAIKSIPRSLFEAADIDGANKTRKLFNIVLPSIKFALFFVSMTSVIIWLQLFEESFVLTKGGPLGATKSAVQFTYESAFTYNNFGYAAASSILLFALILIFTIIQNVMRSKTEE